MAQLQQEQLIAPDERVAFSASDEPSASSSPSVATGRLAFEAPVLAKYTDMAQLLVLDPIHDVDETGWPKIPQAPVTSES